MTATGMRGRGRATYEAVRPYALRVRDDERLRAHALNALDAGERVATRLRGAGASEALRRAATDEVARQELRRAVDELARARLRLDRARSRRRNIVLGVIAGAGAFLLYPAAGTRAMRWVREAVSRARSGSSATTLDASIVVNVPVSTAYNQWTQFEDFPQFMQGVERVEQLDDTRLLWVVRVGRKEERWEAKITEQDPDHRIAWQSTSGKGNSGTVMFRRLDGAETEVSVSIVYPPEGFAEAVGTKLGLDRRRVQRDLARFKELIESRGVESGAWRGSVEGGATTEST